MKKARSSNSARYGRLAEEAAAEKYGLDLKGHHASWKDGIRQNGDPVEIKAAIRKRRTDPRDGLESSRIHTGS